ncbi:MAG: hypothetical protein JO322_04495 [Candidatus Eremiobacteraeota bacterium]|nr:hypothetical protein [Candidatus Eremiobacteraeota bacterium]
MKKFKAAIVAFAVLVLMPIVVQALQTQRGQIGVTIIINVTPNPLGIAAPPSGAGAIVAKASLRGAPSSVSRVFEAQQLHFTGGASVVAQNVQRGVKVEASIAPNPTATLLYSDQNAVVVNAEAGVATVVPCAYHVTVHTTVTSWSLDHGLSNDFSDGSGDSFLGGSVANNSYVATPRPTATPFTVYADNGHTWNLLQTNSGIQTYCVDLTVNMPISTPQGTYSSNAIYTLFY